MWFFRNKRPGRENIKRTNIVNIIDIISPELTAIYITKIQESGYMYAYILKHACETRTSHDSIVVLYCIFIDCIMYSKLSQYIEIHI